MSNVSDTSWRAQVIFWWDDDDHDDGDDEVHFVLD
jgi:hypothetical protein